MTYDALPDLIALIEDLQEALEARIAAEPEAPDADEEKLIERASQMLSVQWSGYVEAPPDEAAR